MKKIISILCVVLLLCSAMSIAVSAAGTIDDPIVFSGPDFNTAKIPKGQTYYISYTDTTAAEKCEIQISAAATATYSVTYGDIVAENDENGFCNIVATPDENNTYLFSITNTGTKTINVYISFIEIVPYMISDAIYEGENAVTTTEAETTLYPFEPTETGIYEITIDADGAILSHWNGSVFYVTGLAEETTEGKLEITCSSIGQSLLIGLGGIDAGNIVITKIAEYIAPTSVEYVTYTNKHTPIEGFQLPDAEMTAVDVTVANTVVLGSDGIYRYGSANGPILYVDMTGVQFADLYECFYPSSGGEKADRMRGTYLDAEGNTCGYDFLNAMQAYADALDSEGYYYLTEDLANYLQMYGKDQGWFNAEYSPFEIIKTGLFNEESAWLVSAYYDSAADGVDPVLPENPVNPENPENSENPEDTEDTNQPDAPIGGDNKPQSPSTGDASSVGAVAALLLSSIGAVTLSKKRK